MIVSEAFLETKRVLSQSARLQSQGLVECEAEQILMACYSRALGKNLTRMDFYSNLSETCPGFVIEKAVNIAEKRVQGNPLQYLIGTQVFLNHEYEVGPGVLIPRPETELLVSLILSHFEKSENVPQLGIEVGLGSGILSIELLSRMPQLRMTASELSSQAAGYACRNARRILGVEVSRLKVLSVLEATQVLEPFYSEVEPGTVDFLVSNPPYMSHSDQIETDVIQYEPSIALFAPDDDLFFYRQFSIQAKRLLKENGSLFLEVPHERAKEISQLFDKQGWKVALYQDLNQRDRMIFAQRN